MKKRALVICKRGIGDSLQHCIVAHNLKKNNYDVLMVTDSGVVCEKIFPLVNMQPLSSYEEMQKEIDGADQIVIKSDSDRLVQDLMSYAKRTKRDKSWVLHPTTCKTKKELPGDFFLNPDRSMVKNLVAFCREALCLESVTSENGITTPKEWEYKKHPKRVIVHPTSSNIERNWPSKKYEKLCAKLQKHGFEPIVCVGKEERETVSPSLFENVENRNIEDSFSFFKLLYESSYFIGSDSGMGHLASNLGIPTVTIFSVRRKRRLWLPGWSPARAVVSFPIFPNMKFCRLQNRYWSKSISVSMVWRAFVKQV